jgi:hypothetical protein
MKKISSWLPVILAVTFLAFVTCVAGRFANQNVAVKLLTANGFTKINLVHRTSTFVGLKGCDKGDLTLFTFKAINSIGKPVTVNVCQGWPFKGATIRSL